MLPTPSAADPFLGYSLRKPGLLGSLHPTLDRQAIKRIAWEKGSSGRMITHSITQTVAA